MDALRQSEKHRDKARQDTEPTPKTAAHPREVPSDLALAPPDIPDHLAEMLDNVPDTDVIDDPSLARDPAVEPHAPVVPDPSRFTPVAAPLKPRHRLDNAWLPGVVAVLSAAAVVAGYYVWKMPVSAPLTAPPAATSTETPIETSEIAPAPAAETGTAKPLLEEPVVQAPSLPAMPAPSHRARSGRHWDSAATPPPDSADIDGIQVRRTQGADPQNQILNQAYADYQAGRLAQAETGYRDILRNFPLNRDALLGLAAIAARAGHFDEARAQYQHIVDLYPGDRVAQSALFDLAHDGDTAQSASTLKYWLQGDNGSAQLQFALGNQYARAANWPDARDAYLQAANAAPDNADYAFNLAVSLDHLGQQAEALAQYRRALALAEHSGGVAFDRQTATARVDRLSGGARQ